jgi:putative transposase
LNTIFYPLLILLANLTDKAVAHQLKILVRKLQFVMAQNEQLRARLPKCVVVTPRERRRLIRLGKPLGTAVKDIITIVTPTTFLRWLREEKAGKKQGKAGRRRRIDVRKLIVKLARENFGWGYTSWCGPSFTSSSWLWRAADSGRCSGGRGNS